jgi:uncharacterized protein (UPF0147 family)
MEIAWLRYELRGQLMRASEQLLAEVGRMDAVPEALREAAENVRAAVREIEEVSAPVRPSQRKSP